MTVKLYDYWRSSAAYRVRIALNLLGIEFESVPVNLLKGEHKAPENLARNPQGLVPTLEIDGRVMTQSLAIVEYLDETRDAGLLPEEPGERARLRAVAYAVAMEIHPVCNLSVARHAAECSDGVITVERWMKAFIGPGLAAVERMLAGTLGPFVHGGAPGLADICLAPQLYNARRWEVDLSAMPVLARIGAALDVHPAVQAAHPDRFAPAA
jgi:maleylacetoacetate isomerase